MRCGRASSWLNLYIDGRLDVRRLSRLEGHLLTCPACRGELARLRMMQAVLREERMVEEPAQLTEHVMGRISAYEAQRASEAALARQRAAALKIERAQAWRGVGARRALALVLALAAVVVWAQMTTPALLSGMAARLGPNLLQLLVTPGPDEIAWSVWIAGGALAVGVFTWLARTDASEELRRALADRLPQLW
ncbi:MAG TPA: zf-HC2 domain-containing protein [Ktedonobacterales bacterium]